MHRLALLCVILALPVAGCHEPVASPSNTAGSDEPWRTLAAGDHSGVQTGARRVITDDAEWARVWDSHVSIFSAGSGPARPAVDFTTERVVAVFLDEKGQSGWHVRVTRVSTQEDATTVELTVYAPDPQGAYAAVMTQPHHIIAIPNKATDVEFVQAQV